MSEDLFRKEAVEHSTRSLYGDVVLTAPPATWVITFILGLVMLIICSLLVFAQVGDVALWRWLWGRAT